MIRLNIQNKIFKKQNFDSDDQPTLVRLRTLVFIRWIAVLGQLLSLLTVYYILDFIFPIELALSVVAVSAGVNFSATILKPASTRLRERGAAMYLGFDVIQLAVLIGLTGGLQNPFAILFLVPVTISASILPLRATTILSILVLTCVSLLAVYHWPLPWGNELLVFPSLYLIALWVALVVGTIVMAAYTARVSVEARNMANALTATQMALAREQRLSAIGALAAAAAHQLGTPLGTIAIAAQELARALPSDKAVSDDAKLIRDEVARCREILRRLSALGSNETEAPYGRILASALVEVAAEPHCRDGDNLTIKVSPTAEGPEPFVPRRAEIVHGLGNILENAFQFTKTNVNVEIEWNERQIILDIRDDGPGFPTAILSRLGEPYVSGRQQSGGLGLGLFIAKTLIERTGGEVIFANGSQIGSSVRVVWSTQLMKSMSTDSV